MGMSFEVAPKPKSKIARLPWPMIAQILSVICGIVCIIMIVPAIYYDGQWNLRLKTGLAKEYVEELKKFKLHNKNSQNSSKEDLKESKAYALNEEKIIEILGRDSWMMKVFCLVIAFGVLMTIEHIAIFMVYNRETYKYNFTIYFNFLLSFIYLIAAIFLLISTLEYDQNYGDMYTHLKMNKIPNTRNITLHLFRFCQVNTGTRSLDQIPDPPPHFQAEFSNGNACQKFSYKLTAVFLALLNFAFFSIVILTVKSTRREIKKIVEHAKDLDVEPWMWSDPNGDKEFIKKYIYEQERAKYTLNEIELEPGITPPPKIELVNS